MQKIPFDISEIRVTKSSFDGYGLDIFLKSDTQLKGKFHDEAKYYDAQKADGNLTLLKHIFRDNIENILKENSQYFYLQSNCELFEQLFSYILEDPKETCYKQSMELLRSCAVEKGIEFDGYFFQRWSDSADTIVSFDEEYFEDENRRDLYVFLSALVDDEIFNFLAIAFLKIKEEKISKESIQEKTDYLTKVKGIRF